MSPSISHSDLPRTSSQSSQRGSDYSVASERQVFEEHSPFDLNSVVLKPRVTPEYEEPDPNVFYWTPAPSTAPTLSVSMDPTVPEHSPVFSSGPRALPRQSPLPPPLPSPTPSTTSRRSSISAASALPESRLFFAIARDSPAEVAKLLAEGEAKATDECGPQSALVFAARNERLQNRGEIVATLLAYGADPSELDPPSRKSSIDDEISPVVEQELDPYVQ